MSYTEQELKKLCDATGAGFLECKDALDKAEGNYEKARQLIKLQRELETAARKMDFLENQEIARLKHEILELKIKLHSATVNTFLWYGNSDPYDDPEYIFDEASGLYTGWLSLWPNKPLNLGFIDSSNSSWHLRNNFLEEREEIGELLATNNLVDKIIEVRFEDKPWSSIECGDIEYVLEDYDWDGFEGEFQYHLTVEILISLAVPLNSGIQEEIENFIYQNLCFIDDITHNKFETTSDDGQVFEGKKKSKYLIVPISYFDFEEKIIDNDLAEPSGDSEELLTLMSKSKILTQFLNEHGEDEDLQAFIKQNDVGFPLARFISTGVASPTQQAHILINETYAMFLEAMEVSDEDVLGVDNLDDLMIIINQKKLKGIDD